MYEQEFAMRLTQLRMQKGVSARDMSLSLGQSASYINGIENGKALPSMTSFFYICEYLHITPTDFFDFEAATPQQSKTLGEKLRRLSPTQTEALSILVDGLLTHK